jgi:CDP-paratose 2-epimerase
MSLAQLTQWCAERYGPHHIDSETQSRAFDVPWLVMNNRSAREQFNWTPRRSLISILDEIAEHAGRNPDWLELSSPR